MSKTITVISAIPVKLHMASIGNNYNFTRKRVSAQLVQILTEFGHVSSFCYFQVTFLIL